MICFTTLYYTNVIVFILFMSTVFTAVGASVSLVTIIVPVILVIIIILPVCSIVIVLVAITIRKRRATSDEGKFQ